MPRDEMNNERMCDRMSRFVTGRPPELGGIEDVAGDGDENCCHACLLRRAAKANQRLVRPGMITVNLVVHEVVGVVTRVERS